jgi:hypothetical protein
VVPVFDPASATGRLLVLDVDPARCAGDVDDGTVHDDRQRAGVEVVTQALAIAELVARLGGQVLADVAPSGGRHVYVVFTAALPWRELRDLCRAIAARFSAVDPAPMSSLGGQISPPGSRHKSGGWRVLSTPVDIALAAVEHPNGPEVWAALLTEFAAELQQIERRVRVTDTSVAELDDAGVPWVPHRGGRASLTPELDRTTRTGRWDRSRYADRSAARMAVLASAAACGWRLADVLEAVSCGTWKAFPGLYYRASEPGRMDRLLPAEWRKAIAFVAALEEQWNEKYRHALIAVASIGVRAGQLGGTAA